MTMTKYADLKAAQRAADVREHHIRMFGEYLDARVRELEFEVKRAEHRLEEAHAARAAFEGKRDLAVRFQNA